MHCKQNAGAGSSRPFFVVGKNLEQDPLLQLFAALTGGRMKHVAIAALLLLVPLQASALDTDDLLGIVAMPLAVAAVSEVTGVPAGELSSLVASLNRADVPPQQFVQVVRYAPAALVVEQQPTFVQYVDEQVSQGVVGSQLVTVIDQRLRTYDVTPQFVTLTEPATTFVVSDDYIPPAVITRVTTLRPVTTQPLIGDANDLLALIAMPLAVNAVSQITGVPLSDLSALVASLNQASVPPMQVIEIVRYAPVALVYEDDGPQFVRFVQTQVSEGITGPRLTDVVVNRLRTFNVSPQPSGTQIAVVDNDFVPAVVRTRVAERRNHPHGGPPGQIKKEIGVQTGAEVVHGSKPGRREARPARVEEKKQNRAVRVTQPPVARRVVEPAVDRGRGNDRVAKPNDNRGGGGKGRGNSGGNRSGNDGGQGQGQGKGKGKGKG